MLSKEHEAMLKYLSISETIAADALPGTAIVRCMAPHFKYWEESVIDASPRPP